MTIKYNNWKIQYFAIHIFINNMRIREDLKTQFDVWLKYD